MRSGPHAGIGGGQAVKVRLSEQGLTAIPRYGGVCPLLPGRPHRELHKLQGSYQKYKGGQFASSETRSVRWGATQQVPDALWLRDLGRALCGT